MILSTANRTGTGVGRDDATWAGFAVFWVESFAREDVKTYYIYTMVTRLVNVRLDATRLRKVRKLRESGLVFSDFVRDAIDRRFGELSGPAGPLDVTAIMKRVFELYPDPPGLPRRSYNLHDRRAARRAILRNLRRRRR